MKTFSMAPRRESKDIPTITMFNSRSGTRSNSTSSTTSCSSTSSTGSASSPKLAKASYRVVLMGAAGVGKTCLLNQFLYDRFTETYKATVEELHHSSYENHGVELTLDILDTSGTYEFPAMRQLSINTGDAFVLVFSVDSEASFEEVRRLRQQILDQKGDDLVPIVVVGNKSDLDTDRREVVRETAEPTVSIDWGNGYVETSAKNNDNIIAVFKELLTQAKVNYALSPAIRRRRESVSSTNTPRKFSIDRLGKRPSCTIS